LIIETKTYKFDRKINDLSKIELSQKKILKRCFSQEHFFNNPRVNVRDDALSSPVNTGWDIVQVILVKRLGVLYNQILVVFFETAHSMFHFEFSGSQVSKFVQTKLDVVTLGIELEDLFVVLDKDGESGVIFSRSGVRFSVDGFPGGPKGLEFLIGRGESQRESKEESDSEEQGAHFLKEIV